MRREPAATEIEIDRDGLGDLWLCWYVYRSDPRRPVSGIEHHYREAQQLRVRDVMEDDRAWEAMSQPDPNQPDLSHTFYIERYEERYRDADAAVFVSTAWTVPEGYVLLGGMHRACALYWLAPSKLDASVIEFAPPLDCPDTLPEPRATTLT